LRLFNIIKYYLVRFFNRPEFAKDHESTTDLLDKRRRHHQRLQRFDHAAMCAKASPSLVRVHGRLRNQKRRLMIWRERLQYLSERQFKARYRLTKATFAHLAEQLRPKLEPRKKMGTALGTELKLSISLRILSGGSHLDVADLHGVSSQKVYAVLWETCEAIHKVIDLHYKG
jgi:hypothetical protein